MTFLQFLTERVFHTQAKMRTKKELLHREVVLFNHLFPTYTHTLK